MISALLLSVAVSGQGSYAALSPGIGTTTDGVTSVVYDAVTGGLQLDVPDGVGLFNAHVESADSLFITENCSVNFEIRGPGAGVRAFDTCESDHVFKGGNFNDLYYGDIMPPGLSRAFVIEDLTARATIWGGPEVENIDLVYVPEPASMALLIAGIFIASSATWRRSFGAT